MKKLIIIAVTLFMATNVFAQEILEVVKVQWENPNGVWLGASLEYNHSKICFSDGSCMYYQNDRTISNKGWLYIASDNSYRCMVSFPVTLGSNIKGNKYQKHGNTFTRVSLQKVGTYTIKKVSVHEVTSEFTASMSGDYSYKWAYVIIAGGGKAKGSISGSAKGGPRTIVNIFFENGKKVTIEASEDPIWLDAEPGMQVEHYRIGDKNFYNLL